jgi:hypothetical protein
VIFELERLEVAGEDRLELSGRWFGVRGRRFMRPTLTLVAADGRHRALADLEHKPWAAEDGESWRATFPWEAARLQVDDMELAVTPDIAVALPAPGERLPRSERAVASGSARLGRRRGEETHEALESARAEARRLRSELDRVEASKVEATAAAARRDAAVAKLDAVIAEHAEALAARDAAKDARDEAIAERDRLAAELDAAVAAQAAAVAERDKAMIVRVQALRARKRALAERDELARARLGLEAERDEAFQSRDNALLARDEALLSRADALRERDTALRPRIEVPAAEPSPQFAPIPPRVITPGRRAEWWPRLIATMALAIAVIVILVIIRSA